MKPVNSSHLKSGRRKLPVGIFLVVIVLVAGSCFIATQFGHLSFNLPVDHKVAYSANTAAYPASLRAVQNTLQDAAGRSVTLRGLMPPDPSRLNEKGEFNQDFFKQIRATGANVIRIPVHPERYERDADYLWRYLDPLVTWSGEMGLYAIIDLHFIGNVETGAGSQMPDLKTPSKEFTLAFWRQTAAYFKDAPNVIFEIVNEPQSISPAQWRQTASEIVKEVRSTGAQQLIIVGGVDFSKDLSWVLDEPVAGDNIAYAAHIYPAHAASSWGGWFGAVSERVPVLVTEWGWLEAAPDSSSAYLEGSAQTYGEPFLTYLENHTIGWVACWYDDEWIPAMFEVGRKQLTPYGRFVNARLSGAK